MIIQGTPYFGTALVMGGLSLPEASAISAYHNENYCIGTCSLCGGRVMSYRIWAGDPNAMPLPGCLNCGARMKVTLPVIEMEKPSGQGKE